MTSAQDMVMTPRLGVQETKEGFLCFDGLVDDIMCPGCTDALLWIAINIEYVVNYGQF